MPQSEGRNDALYAQLQRRMVEDGEWDRLSWLLTQKLNETGWLDECRDKSKEMARKADSMSVEAIMSELRAQAEGEIAALVPARVKKEVMSTIRQYLEKQVEG